MEKYTAFDLELANRHPTSICAIGFCVVENNKVVKTFYSKIKPEPFMIETGNYKIHHLKLSQLQHAPTFDEIWQEISSYFNDTTILGHNIQQDAYALRATLDHYHLPYPQCRLSCSFVLTKKLLKDCPSYKLDSIAKYLGLKFHHHHALEDAMMCFRIIKKIKTSYHVRELDDLHKMLYLDYGKMGDHYYRNIYNSDINSCQEWSLSKEKDPHHFLFHQCVCLDSIHVSYGEMIKKYIHDHGAFLQDKVNLNTNYLIRASYKKTNNYKKAMELKKNGQELEIITLRKFMKMVQEKGGEIK